MATFVVLDILNGFDECGVIRIISFVELVAEGLEGEVILDGFGDILFDVVVLTA
jgi:hypothetical protein